MTYRLFIDDERNPMDVTWGPVEDQVMYRDEEWIIARNWLEVLELVISFGMPKLISFDHDLGEREPTGYDIAKRLVDLTIDAGYELDPEFTVLVHSKNVVGAENIRQYMNNFLKMSSSKGSMK